jgi:hypothetical protein
VYPGLCSAGGWDASAYEHPLTAQTFRHVLEADWDGHTGPIMVSIAVWIAAPLALGVVRTLRREVA